MDKQREAGTGHWEMVAPEPSLAQERGNRGSARTSGMRLSELEHCSFCGDFAGHIFRLLDVRFAVIGRRAREVGALAVGLRLPLRLAEAFAPRPDEAIVIGEDPELVTRLFCCNACLMKPVNIALAIERVTKAREETKAAGGRLPSAPDLDAVAEERKIVERTSGEQKATHGG